MKTSRHVSPLDVLLHWFGTLSPVVSDDLAVRIKNLSPNGWYPFAQTFKDSPGDNTRAFLEAVRTLASRQEMPLGLVLQLISMIDYFLMKRGSPMYWEDAQRQMKSSLKYAQQEGRNTEGLQRLIEEMPLNAKRWQHCADSWITLRETDLAMECVCAWRDVKYGDG
jgi:hypothetical protein